MAVVSVVKPWTYSVSLREATALIDRLLHRCHVLNINRRSYRLRYLERALAGGK